MCYTFTCETQISLDILQSYKKLGTPYYSGPIEAPLEGGTEEASSMKGETFQEVSLFSFQAP